MSFFKPSEEKQRIKQTIAWFTAAKKGETGTMRVMLEQDKGLLNLRDPEGKEALAVAAIALKREAVLWLRDQGASMNAQDDRGYTILHHMVALAKDSEFSRYQYNHDEVEFYLKQGASANVTDNEGNNPLHIAARYKKGARMVVALLSSVDQQQKNADGFTAAELASKYHPDQAPRFLEYARKFEASKKVAQVVNVKPEPEPEVIAEPLPAADWVKTGDNEVAHVQEKTAIGYRLTEIFNFSRQTYVCLARNTDTDVETQSHRDFSDFSSRNILEEAAVAYQKITGVTPDIGVSAIAKQKLQAVR